MYHFIHPVYYESQAHFVATVCWEVYAYAITRFCYISVLNLLKCRPFQEDLILQILVKSSPKCVKLNTSWNQLVSQQAVYHSILFAIFVFLYHCSIIFFLALGLTALTFVVERKQGLLDRTWVAGECTL